MNRRQIIDKPQGKTSLTPCRVCGASGCGYHYGVTTCDACKGFFRRSVLREEQSYVCIQSTFCHVGSNNIQIRNCPKCRYDKCVAVGMSRHACKHGRYSRVKKSTKMKDVREHKTSSSDGESVICNTLTKTIHAGSLKQEYSQLTKPNEFRIPNEPISVALSNDEEMRWNFGGPNGKFPNDNANSASSHHDSIENVSIYKDNPIDDNYDESLSISFLGRYHGSSSEKMEVHNCTPGLNGKSEMSKTGLREPPQMVDSDTPMTSTVLSSSYRSYPDSDNLSAWSPHSIAFGITATQNLVDLSIDPPSTSMLQSIGYPITNANYCFKRSFSQIPNLDDQHLKTTTTNESNYSHSAKSSNTSMNIIKSEREKEDHPQKTCFLQTSNEKTLIEPRILKQKSVFESGQTSSSKPMFLLYVNPNLYNYLISVFERFPFISYEKNSLASILKKCSKNADRLIDFSIIYQSTSDTNKMSLPDSSGALANAPTKDTHSNMCSLRYDQTATEDLFSYLMATHNRYIKDESSFMSDLEIRSAQNIFLDLCQFQEMVHGKMTFIDDDKYYKILETTGLDFDKRREYMLTYIYPNEEYMIKMITFFSSLPGFDDFTLADKITLTKSCTHEYYVLSRHRGIDTNKHIAIDEENGTAYRFCPLMQLFPMLAACQQEWYDITNEMKTLKLSLEEIIVMKALVVTNPDADEILEQPDIVKECHKMYHRCLLNLVRKRHGPQADDRFANIVKVLYNSIVKLRKVKKCSQEQNTEKLFRTVGQETSPLFKEMVTFSTDQNELENAV